MTGLERRLGSSLFKEFLALHFSPSRPERDDWTDHPVIVLLVREIERARADGEVHPEVDAFYSAMFFLLGIYGVLTTTDDLDDPRHACSASWSLPPFAVWRSDDPATTRRSGNGLDVWEILRYVAAWGGTGLIIWFWYWMFSNIGTF